MAIIRYLGAFILFLLLVCILTYIPVPVYKFQEGAPFAGEYIYNPYEGIDSTAWRKANFHAHQKEKPACDYTVEEFLDAYRKSGYDIIGLTDHQHISLEYSDRQGFIPGYEHGFNVNRHHHCLLGADKVWWRDFPVMLTQSQAQYIVKKLKPQGKLLVLNHPGQLRIVDHDIYSRLRGYDLLELNPERQPGSISYDVWDQALSEGIYANQVSDDDAHSISRRGSWFQRSFTMVNTPTYNADDILDNLVKGRSYGVFVPRDLNMSFDHHPDFPKLKNVTFVNDTITVTFSEPASSVKFIGQGGKTLAEYADTLGVSEARYVFADNDTYVRTAVVFPNGIELFLNPYVRTPDGNAPLNVFDGKIDYLMTGVSMLGWSVAAIFLIYLIFKLLRRRKRRNRKYYDLYKDVRGF